MEPECSQEPNIWTLFWSRWIQSTTAYPIPFRFILILSSTSRLGLSNGLFPEVLSNILHTYAVHISCNRKYCRKPLPLLQQRRSRPCVSSPTVLEASSYFGKPPPPPKWRQTTAEGGERSEFWKHLVAACGIFWNDGALCRTITITMHTSSRNEPAEFRSNSETAIVSCEGGGELTVDCQLHHACADLALIVDTAGVSGYRPASGDRKNSITTQKKTFISRNPNCKVADIDPGNSKL
jgi:hypothetical protein